MLRGLQRRLPYEARLAQGAAELERGLPEAVSPMQAALDRINVAYPRHGLVRGAIDLATNPLNARRAETLATLLTNDPAAAMAIINQGPPSSRRALIARALAISGSEHVVQQSLER